MIGEAIAIVAPSDPTPAAYHKILAEVPRLIEQHAPKLVVHIGLDADSEPGVFKLERSAPKEGYHDIPDIDRKVFTRAENKKTFGKAHTFLQTTLDVDAAVGMWQDACASSSLSRLDAGSKKGKSKDRQVVDVRLSDDVGTYVCGFQYYVSMLEAQKKGGRRDVVFLHVPMLKGEGNVAVGIKVVEELIKALVGSL
jgi:pyroglutamyl-peptidase